MMDSAKQFEEEDKKRREEIELRNQADTAVFTAEKMLKESADKIEADDKKKIEDTLVAVKKALEENNVDEIRKGLETLTEAVYAVTTKMYQKVQAEQAAQQQAGSGEGAGPQAARPDDDNVVNAEYKVKDE